MASSGVTTTDVTLVAINDNQKRSSKFLKNLLKEKKFLCHRIHVTSSRLDHDEEFLSDMLVIKELNKRLFLHHTDLSSDTSVQHTVNEVIESESCIDYLVCFIDKRISSPISSQTCTILQDINEQNVYPHIRVITQVIPYMKKKQRGQIAVVNTFTGKHGIPNISAYCAARFTLEGFLESVAKELAPEKIWITIIEAVLDKNIKSPLEKVNSLLQHNDEGDNSEEMQLVERQLEEQKLLKILNYKKLVKCISKIARTEHPDFRVFLNKSCERLAKTRFIKPSETSNILINPTKNETHQQTNEPIYLCSKCKSPNSKFKTCL